MSKKVNKQRKTRERGLNVKITEETKKSKSDAVRVNNNFDKKKARAKRAAKKAETKKVEAKKVDTKKTEEKKIDTKNIEAEKKLADEVATPEVTKETPVEVEAKAEAGAKAEAAPEVAEESRALDLDDKAEPEKKTEAAEANPAKNFSRNSAGSFADVNWAEEEKTPEAEKTPEMEKVPEVQPEEKVEEAPINVLNKPPEPEIEALNLNTEVTGGYDSKIIVRDVERILPENETAPTSQENTTEFNLGSVVQDYHGIGLSTTNEPAAEASEPATVQDLAKASKPTAKDLKEKEISRAIKNASKLPDGKHRRKRFSVHKVGMPRMILAVSCMATAIFAIAYFINLSASDMSIKVAAMQSGIEASYPSYIPRGYSLSDVTSSSGKVIMRFKCDDGEYVISEETSTWDSNALLSNYVKPEYGDDYTVVKEQGLTLYMGNRWETWVNGGMLYKLTVTEGSLTKKQLKTIATSL